MALADEAVLRAIAGAIDGVVYTPSSSIAGRVAGHAITYRLTTHGDGSGVVPVTEIEALVEPSAIELELRPQDETQERLVKKGAALDLSLDDEAFDRAFIVEGAPSEAIKKWLTKPIRERLVSHAPLTVELRGKLLVVSKARWVEDPAQAQSLAHGAAMLATEHARVVRARRDDALASASAQRDGYRNAVSPDSARHAIARAERAERDEIAKLAAVRGARSADRRVAYVAGVILTLTLVLAFLLFAWVMRS